MSSRFLNVSPRAYLRQTDCVNNLPPVSRITGRSAAQDNIEPFSDKDTILFDDNRVVVAPYMIEATRALGLGFDIGSIFLTSSIRDRSAFQSRAIQNTQIFPYREENVVNPAAFKSGSETEGFPEEKYPGFSSSERSKITISFDITSRNDSKITKANRAETLRDPSGPFYGTGSSGFFYYNSRLRRWVDVGGRNPVGPGSTVVTYDPTLIISGGTPAENGYYKISTLNQAFLSQFSSSPYSIVSESPNYSPEDIDALKSRGYDKIGEPTSFFGAPHSPRYHARTTESFKFSDYTRQPFAIDRITVNLPVRVYRTQIPPTGSGDTTDYGFGRDIDNYVFFVYAQNRSAATNDSAQDVSSSIRYLIGKQSFCFYNSPALDLISGGLAPIHDYGFAAPFTMSSNIASSSGSPVEVSQEFTVNMTFRPSTFNNIFGTTSKLPGRASLAGGKNLTGSVFIQNYWTGGQRASGSLGEFARVDTTANLNVRSGSISPVFQDPFISTSQKSIVSSFWEATNQTVLSGSGFSDSGVEISTVSSFDPSSETIVILNPEDEIVFGIESGANSNMFTPGRSYDGVDNDVLAVTGSRIEIDANKGAWVVLYGNLVANGREYYSSLYQHLGSDAVHEDIHEIGPLDQFDILDSTILSSSYLDNIFTGNIFTGDRKIAARASRGESWITGSLQRNVRISNSSDLFYDTFLPEISVISGGIENTTSTNVIFPTRPADPSTLRIVEDATNGFAFDNNRSNGNLLKRFFTYEGETNQPRIKDITLTLYYDVLGTIFANTLAGDAAKFALYYNGEIPTLDLQRADQKGYSGASSLRYGLMNPRLTGPSFVFRRDRYGQPRDMLEQSRDGKIVTNTKGRDTVGSAVVVAKFVSASSDIVTDGIYTQCSNLSMECTSSAPFSDDGVVRNRGPLPTNVVKFGPNNLIFGVTGSFNSQ
jgi:hypothetical protein